VTLTNGGANSTGTNYADFGGAISTDGTLSLSRCTLSGNTADFGGAITANTATAAINNTSGMITVTDPGASGKPNYFYRMQVQKVR